MNKSKKNSRESFNYYLDFEEVDHTETTKGLFVICSGVWKDGFPLLLRIRRQVSTPLMLFHFALIDKTSVDCKSRVSYR